MVVIRKLGFDTHSTEPFNCDNAIVIDDDGKGVGGLLRDVMYAAQEGNADSVYRPEANYLMV